MLSAQEATKLSQEAHKVRLRQEHSRIESLITLAAREGDMKLYTGALSDEIQEELKQLGYEVKRASKFEEKYLITWGN